MNDHKKLVLKVLLEALQSDLSSLTTATGLQRLQVHTALVALKTEGYAVSDTLFGKLVWRLSPRVDVAKARQYVSGATPARPRPAPVAPPREKEPPAARQPPKAPKVERTSAEIAADLEARAARREKSRPAAEPPRPQQPVPTPPIAEAISEAVVEQDEMAPPAAPAPAPAEAAPEPARTPVTPRTAVVCLFVPAQPGIEVEWSENEAKIVSSDAHMGRIAVGIPRHLIPRLITALQAGGP